MLMKSFKIKYPKFKLFCQYALHFGYPTSFNLRTRSEHCYSMLILGWCLPVNSLITIANTKLYTCPFCYCPLLIHACIYCSMLCSYFISLISLSQHSAYLAFDIKQYIIYNLYKHEWYLFCYSPFNLVAFWLLDFIYFWIISVFCLQWYVSN